jgi:hypothetical protein
VTETAVVTVTGVGALTVRALFSGPAGEVMPMGAEFQVMFPRLWALESELPGVAQGHSVRFRETNWTVNRVDSDACGGVWLTLEKA